MKRILISEEERSRILGMHQEKGYKPLMEQAAQAPAPAQGQSQLSPTSATAATKDVPMISGKDNLEKYNKFTKLGFEDKYFAKCGFSDQPDGRIFGTEIKNGVVQPINQELFLKNLNILLRNVAGTGVNYNELNTNSKFGQFAYEMAKQAGYPVEVPNDPGKSKAKRDQFYNALTRLITQKVIEVGGTPKSGFQGCTLKSA